MEVKDLISLCSVLVALIAVLMGPIVNSRISKRAVLSPMRQAWINSLRDKLAEFTAAISITRWNYCPSTHWEEDRKERALNRDLKNYERVKLLEASIRLQLNPKEEDHRKLVELIRILVEAYHDADVTDVQVDELTTVSQKILKKEWEVTKKT